VHEREREKVLRLLLRYFDSRTREHEIIQYLMSCSESQLSGTKLGKGANVECSKHAVLSE